ncbi:MAG TPA: permease-like cell division protein FtsX [Candidatus Saccharimonadales bacterium]|nr:permease-like cell division protein FtsX [Candidatus Saccharimonadales bacterium]
MKRRIITFWRIIKAGIQNFLRNATLAVAAMAVMIITLTIVLFSVIANATFTHTIQQITDKIDISVYLKDSVSPEQRQKLIKDISAMPNTKSVNFITKDQALETYKNQNQNNLDLLQAISQTDNPLPASLQIKPWDPNKIQDLKTYLEKPDVKALQSDETSYSGARKEAIDKISKATKFMREVGLGGVIVFALVSMLIIFNTIRMAIFNRRDELTIMRLLGASSWYIRGPFVVETMIYGIVSAVISVTLCNTLFVVAASAFQASSLGLLDINFSNDYFGHHFWLILTSQLGIGILIGAASSLIATRRYLKFKSAK